MTRITLNIPPIYVTLNNMIKKSANILRMRITIQNDSEIVLSDTYMPIIMSALLGDNTNEHNLNQHCLDEFKIKGHENSIKNAGSYSGCLIDYKTDQDDF